MQWANVYEHDSPSRKLINDMMNSYFLVNVVHNDFKDTDLIFKGFHDAAAGFSAQAMKGAITALGESLQNGRKIVNDVAHGMGKESLPVTVA